MRDELLTFYSGFIRSKPHITEKELFTEIESHFGDELMRRVCIPNNINLGACVIAAIALCRKAIPYVVQS